ncbi:MAG TPA: ABC transporter permease subunit [Paenirhodobacter sp.]
MRRPLQPGWRRAQTALLPPLVATIAVLALVEIAQRLHLLPVFIPAPSQVIGVVIAQPRLLTQNVGPTVAKAAGGFAAAFCIALIAMMLTSAIRWLKAPVFNAGVVLNAIPVIATAPLLALWLGTGPSLQVVIAAMSCQFPILVGMMRGMDAADHQRRELFHILSASKLQTFRRLLLPASLPYVFAGLKIAAPAALLGTITAEWAGASNGVGAMMLYALFSYNIETVWLSVLVTCILSACAYALCELAERKIVYWIRDGDLK